MIATQETEKLVRLRHELHANPELSGQENNTAKRLLDFLKTLNPDQILQNLGGNGIALVFKGKAPGKRVLFRADMDALPIQEKNELSYASKNTGVAHLCGHDGHSSILAGFALVLNKKRPEKGEVILLFQPAEETGKGALQVINDPQFESIKPDMAFALHNLPGFERHTIVLREQTFAAASVGIKNPFYWSHSTRLATRNRPQSCNNSGKADAGTGAAEKELAIRKSLQTTYDYPRQAWR